MTSLPIKKHPLNGKIAILLLPALLVACSAEGPPESTGTVTPEKNSIASIDAAPADEFRAADYSLSRNAYFGDLHLHTSNSFDAAWAGVRTSRSDAYRYAQGEKVMYFGEEIQRRAPLDFLAVADHAEYMGVTIRLLDEDGPFTNTDWPAKMLDEEGGPGQGFRDIMGSGFYGPEVHEELNTKEIRQSNWQAVIEAADEYNQPGEFTTFAAFEWSNTPEGAHFHRNVIFLGPEYPEVPFSALESRNPEDLWRYADANRANGIDSILIPHNMNLSGGRQFAYTDMDGNEIDREFAEAKGRNETLIEITQIKGTSETHPEISPNDEFAGFEILDHYAQGEKTSPHGSYAREGLARGMEIAAKVGANPYQYGFIGSSDYHSSTTATEEDNHTGALGTGDLPAGKENAERVLSSFNQVIRAPLTALAASGIAGIWAEQNTRESLFSAMKRRETFATSGSRMQVRMFAGWEYEEGLVSLDNWLPQAYAGGVPMGGDLLKSDKEGSPRFLLQALKDPDGANLDRIQVVKVWYKDGESHEQVFDVVWAGDRDLNADTGKVPAIENTVDVETATYVNTVGVAQLIGEWVDLDFDQEANAVYYARVMEIHTPRWPVYLAVRNNLPIPDSAPTTHQERAWTSPIFYNP